MSQNVSPAAHRMLFHPLVNFELAIFFSFVVCPRVTCPVLATPYLMLANLLHLRLLMSYAGSHVIILWALTLSALNIYLAVTVNKDEVALSRSPPSPVMSRPLGF